MGYSLAAKLQKIREMISTPVDVDPKTMKLITAAFENLPAEGKWLVTVSLTRYENGTGLCHYVEMERPVEN
jgi:hypothetical protein